MMNKEEIIKAIEDKIVDCLIIAENYFKQSFKIPTIRYDIRSGRLAGQWHKHIDGTFHVRFNMEMALQEQDKFINRTVPHELAHHIDYLYNGYFGHHGRNWKNIMEVVFNLPATRCHSYDTSKLIHRNTIKKHEYKCACKDSFFISTIKHNRIQQMGYNYICLRCKERIVSKGKFIFK